MSVPDNAEASADDAHQLEFTNPIFDDTNPSGELHADTAWTDEHHAMSDSMCIELDQASDDSGEEDLTVAGPRIVKQQWKPHTIQTANPLPPASDKAGPASVSLNSKIYQGLAMTEADERSRGLMPESVFMTARLEEEEQNEMPEFRLTSHIPYTSPFQPTLAPIGSTGSTSETINDVMTASCRSPTPDSPSGPAKLVTPPTPPALPETASKEEQKRRHILENLVTTEASLLNSLNIAVHSYMNPLRDFTTSQEPILETHEVNTLFGPVEGIVSCHNLFYLALCSKTSEWGEGETIGDCILSSFSGNVAVKTYSEYVNNFTDAMSVLESRIKKKPRFVAFLKQTLCNCGSNLSLQGLLLKPIQRFPQYILILQDFLKHTPSTHPDQMPLQMALTRLEGIAEHLNEAKREREQRSIVHYLNSRIHGLPFKLIDSQRRLLRQDVVTRLLVKDSKVVRKKRTLLLFSNMVLCASVRYKNIKNPSMSFQEFPDAEGAKFQCKWYCTLDRLSVEEPDFSMLDSTNAFSASDNADVQASFTKLKTEHEELESDFLLMSKMELMVKGLKKSYQGLDADMLSGYCKQLLKMIAKNESLIRQCEGGRLDITIPTRDGGQKVKHIYMLRSQQTKENWLRTLRFARTKLASPNGLTWYLSADQFEEEESVVVHDRRLPLYLNSFKVTELTGDRSATIRCAECVSGKYIWLAASLSEISILECSLHTVNTVSVFSAGDSRVLCMLNAIAQPLMGRHAVNVTPSNTVWVGSEGGDLLVYNATPEHELIHSCTLEDTIVSLVQVDNHVCVGSADGNLICYSLRKDGKGWDLANPAKYHIHPAPLTCMCKVEDKVWIGSENYCIIFNLATKTVEKKLEASKLGKESQVRKMVHVGAGVWVSLRQEMKLVLFHTSTHALLQEVNVGSNIKNILHSAKITKLSADHVYVSAMLATKGLLWLGTSLGVTLIYRIPCLEGVPLINGRPYLAFDAHNDTVRMLLSITCKLPSVKKRIGTRVLRDHVRKMNRPISFGYNNNHAASVSPETDVATPLTDSMKLSESAEDERAAKFADLNSSDVRKLTKEVLDVAAGATTTVPPEKSSKILPPYDAVELHKPTIGIELTADEENGHIVTNSSHNTDNKLNADPATSTSPHKDNVDIYEEVEYPADSKHLSTPDLYQPMHPRQYTMSIPGKDDSLSPGGGEVIRMVVTGGRGLTTFRKLKYSSRTIYHKLSVRKEDTQDGYLIMYELDSTIRMFSSESNIGEL